MKNQWKQVQLDDKFYNKHFPRTRRSRAYRDRMSWLDKIKVTLAVVFALVCGVSLAVPTILKLEALVAFTDYLNRH